MEWLHHVDLDDCVLGRVSREEAHTHGLLHRAGCVTIHDATGRMFVARRSATKSIFPGALDWPCSFHVSFDESYEDAARRELLEETGIDGIPVRLGKVVVNEPPDHLVVAVFVLEYLGPVSLDPLEASSGEWIDRASVARSILEGTTTSWMRVSWPMVVAAMSR